MSRYSSNAGDGCLGQLIVWGAIVLIFLIVDAYNGSQYAMIKEARERNDVYNYMQYINKHPEGDYVSESCDSIFSILSRDNSYNYTYGKDIYKYISLSKNNDLTKRLSELAYSQAKKDNTIEGWKLFIEHVPGKYQRDASDKISQLDNELWGTERKAWITAETRNTINSYSEYMDRYPKGSHYNTAKKRYIDMTVSNDFRGEHGVLPSMDKVSSKGKRNGSYLSIKNSTSYTLTVLYSGDYSDRLIIEPHSTNSIKLPNGKYRVSAKVDASRVRPFVGTEDLTGGEYSSEYYIQTSYR